MPTMINRGKEMLNRFHNGKVTEDNVREAADALAISRGTPVVACDINIVRAVMRGADNYVLVKGAGKGPGRFPGALEDAAGKSRDIAAGYDLFGADNVLLHIEHGGQRPFSMEELTEISSFSRMFEKDVCPVISVAVDNGIKGDDIVVRLLATNLQRLRNPFVPGGV